MGFKISEDFQEEEKVEKKDNGKLKLIIIVIVALAAFVLVYTLLNSAFKPKKDNPTTPTSTSETKSLTDSNVKILYNYVTYSATGDTRYDIFVKNKKVTLDTFTEEEKYYYALQYVQAEDFDFTGELDENKNKIYSISNNKIKKYMEYFFGKGVKYSTDLTIKYPFSFSINDKNVGIMKYDDDTESFNTVFEKDTSTKESYVVEPYMGKLVEAYKDPDGSYRIIEKLIYVRAKKQSNGMYEVTISKDYDGENVIESSIDQTEDDLQDITISKYLNKAATITYTFKITDTSNILYFYSSKIK